MRIVPLAMAFALAAVPALAQGYGEHDGQDRGHRGWAEYRQERNQRHHARDAMEAARQNAWHARRDAAMGDYQGAAQAEARARAAVRDAWRHRELARQSRDFHGRMEHGGHND